MALWARYNIVEEDANLVSQAFVIFLVATAKYLFERMLQSWDNFRVDSQLMDGFFAANLNKVP